MKKMKSLLLAGVLLFSLGASLSACSIFSTDTPSISSGNSEQKDYKVAVSSEDLLLFTVTTDVMALSDSTSLKEYMEELQKLGLMTFDGQEGAYGYTLTTVNGHEQAADWSTYWGVYTTLGEYEGVIYAVEKMDDWENPGTEKDVSYTYDGTKYLYAMYGIDGLPAIEGYSYLLRFVG